MSTDLETTEAKGLAPLSAAEQALIDDFKQDMADLPLTVPVLTLVQGTSKKPPKGSKPGDFVNTLTNENFGTEFEFVIAHYSKGRFWSYEDKTGRRVGKRANGPTVPESWDHPCAGRRFDECPDAHEMYSAAVNDPENDQQWGRGPGIANTHDFIGFVVGSRVPVRLSLMKSQVPVATKISTLIRAALRAPWDNVFVLGSEDQLSVRDERYQGVTAELGRDVTPEERQAAVDLATQLRNRGVADATEEGSEEQASGGSRKRSSAKREGGPSY